ncbi:hypothetical protein N7492_004340 [Penicillium capsulatum]|uniref:Uncharacterized protein n=1 Tax=Penicillium capsulatum TaxID=69766 RepID=A0A9W9LQ45_9EURO|nr:hypothetical protein N7492_004340 [Penicillium capsulatum]
MRQSLGLNLDDPLVVNDPVGEGVTDSDPRLISADAAGLVGTPVEDDEGVAASLRPGVWPGVWPVLDDSVPGGVSKEDAGCPELLGTQFTDCQGAVDVKEPLEAGPWPIMDESVPGEISEDAGFSGLEDTPFKDSEGAAVGDEASELGLTPPAK